MQKYLLFFLILFFTSCETTNSKHSIYKKGEIVLYETDALEIAESAWLPIYGKMIEKEKPFVGTLVNDSLWIVIGNLDKNKDGGTLYAKIRKKDGEILEITHEK
jgi:hypothetical protein